MIGKMSFWVRPAAWLYTLCLTLMASTAFSAQPTPWALDFQQSASSVMDDIVSFHNFILVIITLITLFVLALLIYCVWKFRASANPNPSSTTHNTLIEVIWSVVPILILIMIAIPSFRILYDQLEIPEADLTIKATGYQWYWGYEYPDHDELSFDSIMLSEEERAEKIATGADPASQPRLLATDTALVVPVGKTVRVQVTAADVLHAFAMPAFGVKIDAVPGRLNETWFRADRLGTFYGQCSELCGKDHAYMPIKIIVVEPGQFDAWVAAAQDDIDEANELLAQSSAMDTKPVQVAQQ